MDNIFIRTDPAGNIKPDKEKSTEKIDGAVATNMSLDKPFNVTMKVTRVFMISEVLFLYKFPERI